MLSWKHVFIATPTVALLLGFFGVGFSIYIGDIDIFCEIGGDGTGLIPLGEANYGPNAGCDPLPLGIALGSTYFGSLLYLPILLILSVLKMFLVLVKRIVRKSQSRAVYCVGTQQNNVAKNASSGRERRWTQVLITTPIIAFFLGLCSSGYFTYADRFNSLCSIKDGGGGLIPLRSELYGPNASCDPNLGTIALLGIASVGITYIPVLLVLSAVLFSPMVINRNKVK